MSAPSSPLILINAVGMTSRLLPFAPRMKALAESGWARPLRETIPAVTCSAQASILTGTAPNVHGVVGNGWLFRDTMEVRFWQQSNTLVGAEPLYATARRRASEAGRTFRSAKLFWWFNQGARVDLSVTPKPFYGADGNKAFGVSGTPEGLTERIEAAIGPFPFPTFWGPKAGLASTAWIARCAAEVAISDRPDLTMVYLPHLDYDPQRFGPSGSDMPRLVGELDETLQPILDAAKAIGARIWIVSEYGHCDVDSVAHPNRALREAGLLAVRPGPFGEILETHASRAFAVCDHQLAHVYVRDADDIAQTREVLEALPETGRILVADERAEVGLDHPRSGEIVLLSRPNAWWAYPFWLDDAKAPDYARTVDIHRKPGYDPCELFLDPALRLPMAKLASKLLRKKLGFRTLFDVIPLDASLVKGSHGLAARDRLDRPILIGDGPAPHDDMAMPDVRDVILNALL